MNKSLEKRIQRIRELIKGLKTKTKQDSSIVAFIVYGSFSEASDHEPTIYSDIDLEIVVKDEAYKVYLANFRKWFELNFEPVLLETSVGHLEKIFVTGDFVNLEFHISRLSDFENIDKRELNYFPSGYAILFDKSKSLDKKIKTSVKPKKEIRLQEKFDKLNNKFWYFVLGVPPHIKKREYWFAAAGYWFGLYGALCSLLRIYYEKEVGYNPMKHIEEALDKEVIRKIQPLRNLEKPEDLKSKMKLLIDVYSEYTRKTSNKFKLTYNQTLENKIRKRVDKFLN